jgi:anthranilate synthase component 2
MRDRRVGSVARSPSSPRVPRGAVWLVDNYDSFTENLSHALATLGADVVVVRNDATTPRRVLSSRPAGVVLSPGPCTPAEAGISTALVRACAAARPPVPVLGVCLGHQAIAEAFGGRTVRARRPTHGRATTIARTRESQGVLAGLPACFPAARYHSLVTDGARLPKDLVVTAVSREGDVMAFAHRSLPIDGVQFHPESYLTPIGPRILAAFLARCGIGPRRSPRARRPRGRARPRR